MDFSLAGQTHLIREIKLISDLQFTFVTLGTIFQAFVYGHPAGGTFSKTAAGVDVVDARGQRAFQNGLL